MNNELKKKLLSRKFSSVEYMEEMARFHQKAIDGLKESLRWFADHPPEDVDWQNWHVSDKPEEWERRALPNFIMNQNAFLEGIEKAKEGDLTYIEDATGSIQGLSKDMDVLGEKWWDFVDRETARRFGVNLNEAEQRASNIWWTIGEYWDGDEILDEEITGPVDEQDLLRYLKPGENPE